MNLKLVAATVLAAAFASPLAAQTGAEAFQELDKNKDGFLSKEEAKGSAYEKDFDKLDRDGDGKLSREEATVPAVGPAQSSSERTAEPQPSPPSTPTGEVRGRSPN